MNTFVLPILRCKKIDYRSIVVNQQVFYLFFFVCAPKNSCTRFAHT